VKKDDVHESTQFIDKFNVGIISVVSRLLDYCNSCVFPCSRRGEARQLHALPIPFTGIRSNPIFMIVSKIAFMHAGFHHAESMSAVCSGAQTDLKLCFETLGSSLTVHGRALDHLRFT
jgi:hypothetical protein